MTEAPNVKSTRLSVVAVIVALIVFGAGALVLGPLRGPRSAWQYLNWLGDDVHRRLFPEQNPEGPVYADTAKGPITLARMVNDFHAAWPDQNPTVVHGAALDVSVGLLHHRDIEVGAFEGKNFVASPLKPWEAAAAIGVDLKARNELYDDGTRHVFRRK